MRWSMKGCVNKGLSLRIVLLLYVVAPLSIALIVTGYFSLRIWERQVESRMQSDLEMVARAIQLPLSHAMERDRTGGIEQTLESALSVDSVYSAYAYNYEGERIASAGEDAPDPERDKLMELASNGERVGEYGDVGKRRVYSYFVPLTDSRDQASGLLQLTRRERDFRDYIGMVRRHALVWFSLGLLLMIGLVLVGQYQALGRHFQRLIFGMQLVANGDTTHRMPVSGPREIGAIATGFNEMLDGVQRAENEIKRKKEEQIDLERRLRHAEKLAAVGRLAAGVAHELGTPLSTIRGMAQRRLRREPSKSNANAGDTFRRIQNEVDRVEVIIRQLLDFSHSRPLQRRMLRPDRVAASAVAAVSGEAARRNVVISAAGDTSAPSFSADPLRLEQAVVNLLRNAIQAGSNIAVRISWRTDDSETVFCVDDSGPGIPEEIRPRLFEPFFTTKDIGAGSGLGLAVVHGIMEEHDGCVRSGCSDFGGARFELHLPVHAAGRGEKENAENNI